MKLYGLAKEQKKKAGRAKRKQFVAKKPEAKVRTKK